MQKESSITGPGISTHVLDTTSGRPAEGVAVRLFRREPKGMVAAGGGTTDADGRITRLLEGELLTGWYQLVFDLSTYYGSQQHFFGRVAIDIAVSEVRQHHVPLLVSPHSCTAYRGS